MVELRWIETKTERLSADIVKRVLQYRQTRKVIKQSGFGSYMSEEWTDWTDVPTEESP